MHVHSRQKRDITWTLNSTPWPLRPHYDCILVRATRGSQQCGHNYQEKSCYTVNKVPLTKSRLDWGLLLSPATTDYSRLLKIQLVGFLNLHIQNALDSNHFPLFQILGLQIGRGKKSQTSQDFQRQIHGKIG